MSIESRRHQYGTVFDHWKIRESLGEGSGGKSAVYRLEHEATPGVESALKVVSLLKEDGSWDEMMPERQEGYERSLQEYSETASQEVLLMNALRGNTHIVDYLDHAFVDWSDATGFGRDMLIRMERLTDLRGRLRKGERFERDEIIKMGLHICDALILCHSKNIIHRDIKPGNIFYNNDGNYKLGDFGISRILDSSASFMASTGIGTPQYLAPEQLSGKYDWRVDIYSLGLVLYEMCNGNRLPFAASSYVRESEVRRRLMGETLPAPCDADEALTEVIRKACAFYPEDRYQTAEAFYNALASLYGEPTQPATGGKPGSGINGNGRIPGGINGNGGIPGGINGNGGIPGGINGNGGTPGGINGNGGTPGGGIPGSGSAEEETHSRFGILVGIAAVLLALLLGFAAWMWYANRNDDDGGKPGDDPEETPATEVTDSDTLAFAEVTDALMECAVCADTESGYCCYHLPQVLLDGNRGDAISAVIYDELYAVLESRVFGMDTPGLAGMYYSWGRRENTLSVLVETSALTYDETRYYTYHVSAKSGKVLEDGYILSTCGLSTKEYHNLVEAELREFYEASSAQILPHAGEEGLKELIAKSTAEDNLNAARPYIGADGELCAVVGYYWFAGSGYYYRLVNLTGTSEPEAPACGMVHDLEAIAREEALRELNALKARYADAEVGDIITFGTYEQDYNLQNGREAIEWLVLDKKDGKLFVVSLYGLDCQRYNTTFTSVTWATCSLRQWLNDDFYNAAFSDEEKQLIPSTLVKAEQNPYYNNDPGSDTYDYVYLLSTGEADKYFTSDVDRICLPTTYAAGRGDCVVHPQLRSGWWWLRNVGEFTTDASCINCDGVIDYKDGSVNNNSAIIRPALWIEIA